MQQLGKVRRIDVVFTEGARLRLRVSGRSFRGAENLYELALPDGQRVLCLTPSHVDVAVGGELPVEFQLRHVVVCGGDAGASFTLRRTQMRHDCCPRGSRVSAMLICEIRAPS